MNKKKIMLIEGEGKFTQNLFKMKEIELVMLVSNEIRLIDKDNDIYIYIYIRKI